MAASKAELWDQLLKSIKIVDELYAFCATNSPNFLAMESTLQIAFEGDHVGQTQQQMTSIRGSLSSLISQFSSVLRPVILELARIGYNSTSTSVTAALADIRQGMIDGSETVRHRDITQGAISAAGGNNGNGTVLRLYVDKDDEEIESIFPEAGDVKIEVSTDFATGGTKGSEIARIFGDGIWKFDELNLGDAPSLSANLTAVTSDDSLLSNAGFETSSGTAPTIDFSDWTLAPQASFDVDTTIVFRGDQVIDFVDDGKISQFLTSLSINKALPVFAFVMFYRESNCDGTLTLRLGSQTEAVVLSAQSGWTMLALGINDSNEGWYDNFKEDFSGEGIRVELELSGWSTGNLLVDGFIVAQPINFDGLYYMLQAGDSDNEFLVGDNFTFSDSVANTGRTQYILSRLFAQYLPHASSSETYADA